MKNTIGNALSVTLFGESHGDFIGAVMDGLPSGVAIDNDYIAKKLSLRRPSGQISTPRVEPDEFMIVSGLFEGKTTGTPLTIVIPNTNTDSGAYSRKAVRPGHADYTAFVKYGGFEDYRGGGHFSGRLTAALVAAGAVACQLLDKKDISVATHISRLGGVDDRGFGNLKEDIEYLNSTVFAVLDENALAKMTDAIMQAKNEGDSVGGILETIVTGMPAGIGEPWFDTLESVLSHALFSIPAVKGVEFGAGFKMADMKGSKANDPFYNDGGKIVTSTNNNGGINGGISNGMPITVRTAIKPTPTIFKEQDTINAITGENTKTEQKGRHDPCIVHRARVVADSVVALTLCDMMAIRYGTNWVWNTDA